MLAISGWARSPTQSSNILEAAPKSRTMNVIQYESGDDTIDVFLGLSALPMKDERRPNTILAPIFAVALVPQPRG